MNRLLNILLVIGVVNFALYFAWMLFDTEKKWWNMRSDTPSLYADLTTMGLVLIVALRTKLYKKK